MADVLIAGGGLAGSALAIRFGRLGLSVELFESASFPREKPCGEGLMPAGVAALDRLEIADAPEWAPFSGIHYHWNGKVARGNFPQVRSVPAMGRGYRRRDLDLAMFSAARSTPGVTAYTDAPVEAPRIENGRVTGLIVAGAARQGRLVVAADGAQSRLRHALGLNAPARRKRVGMRAHFRLAPDQPLSERVDVYLGQGFELYVTPLRKRELLVAALARAEVLDGPLEAQYRRWLTSESALARRLQGAEQTSELRVTSPLSGRARRGWLPGLVLVGDAAGYTDPITGSGMTQALLAAELLAQFAAQGLDTADRWLAEFDCARAALLRDCRRMTALVLWLADHPAFFGKALEAVGLWPRLMSHFLGVSGGVLRLWGGPVKTRS